MPAIEAQEDETADEAAEYECAFHILPTIAEEEVSGVAERLNGLVAHAGGTITHEEIVGTHDLAYEITKQIDGANRKFNAAHFCWIRFMLAPSALEGVAEEIAHMPEVLRHLLIRLTREEIEKPFFILEAAAAGPTESAR